MQILKCHICTLGGNFGCKNSFVITELDDFLFAYNITFILARTFYQMRVTPETGSPGV